MTVAAAVMVSGQFGFVRLGVRNRTVMDDMVSGRPDVLCLLASDG